MTTVADILDFLNTIAPPEIREDWDNVGLNCGRMNRPVDKILIALDPFREVCQEAANWGAQLLITHHILIWLPVVSTTFSPQGLGCKTWKS